MHGLEASSTQPSRISTQLSGQQFYGPCHGRHNYRRKRLCHTIKHGRQCHCRLQRCRKWPHLSILSRVASSNQQRTAQSRSRRIPSLTRRRHQQPPDQSRSRRIPSVLASHQQPPSQPRSHRIPSVLASHQQPPDQSHSRRIPSLLTSHQQHPSQPRSRRTPSLTRCRCPSHFACRPPLRPRPRQSSSLHPPRRQ